MLEESEQASSLKLYVDLDIDDDIEEDGFVPEEIIKEYRTLNKQLIDYAIAQLRKENPRITDADIKARTKRVDLYLRLSKLKSETPQKSNTKEGTIRIIPGRRDKAKTTKIPKKTGESMTAQFFSCIKRMNQEISEGNLWVLCEVWQEVYDGPEYRKRPLINMKFKQRVHTRKIDILLCRHRDRLARGKGLIVLIEELKAYNVEFKAAMQRDLGDTIIDDLELSFEAAITRQENTKIKERIHERLDYRQQQNKLNGSAHLLYGYEYDDGEGKRYIHAVEGPRVQWAFNAREKGMAIRKIAVAMNDLGWRTRSGNLWGKKSVSNMLHNRAYMGETIQYRKSYIYEHTGEGRIRRINPERETVYYPEGTTPALVSKEQWHRVNALLDEARDLSPRNVAEPEKYTLLHFLRCAYCHDRLIIKRTNKGTSKSRIDNKEYTRKPQYVCQNATRPDNPCSGVTIMAHIIEEAAWEFIGHELEESLPNLRKALEQVVSEQTFVIDANSISRTIKDINKKIAELEKDKQHASNTYTKEVIQQGIDRLLAERADYEKDLENAHPDKLVEEEKKKTIENLLAYAEEARQGWRKAEVEERRSYLALLDFCGYIAKESDTEHDRWEFTLGLKKFFQGVLSENHLGRIPRP